MPRCGVGLNKLLDLRFPLLPKEHWQIQQLPQGKIRQRYKPECPGWNLDRVSTGGREDSNDDEYLGNKRNRREVAWTSFALQMEAG